jgi:hypothetical protein
VRFACYIARTYILSLYVLSFSIHAANIVTLEEIFKDWGIFLLCEHDIRTICAIVLVDKSQRADVQSCGATVISKYAAMMSWVS